MTTQPQERSSVEALRLAEILDGGSHQFNDEAAAELRRLHAENEELRRTVRLIVDNVRRKDEASD